MRWPYGPVPDSVTTTASRSVRLSVTVAPFIAWRLSTDCLGLGHAKVLSAVVPSCVEMQYHSDGYRALPFHPADDCGSGGVAAAVQIGSSDSIPLIAASRLGGGAVEDKRTRAVLRNARVVYLRVSYDEAMSRIRGDEFRPLLTRPDLDQGYGRRLPIYEDVSVFTMDTDGRRPDAIAREALAELTRLPTTPPKSSSVLVTPIGGSYYAHIGPHLA